MANISVEGFVNERRGKMLRISEEYRKRNDAGEWESNGYGAFTVWLRKEDQQPELQKGAVVNVTGRLMVTTSEKNGVKYTNLNINADSVGIVRKTSKYEEGNAAWGAAEQHQWSQPSGNYSEEVPF